MIRTALGLRNGSSAGSRRGGFTLIELLTVIAIMMVVMALALPNFISMARQRMWSSSISDLQGLIWRARAVATGQRKDTSVEFDIRDNDENGTRMWIESESNFIETLPNLVLLQNQLGASGVRWMLGSQGEFYAAGGNWSGWDPYTFTWDPQVAKPEFYGDNAFQSEEVRRMAKGLTVDPAYKDSNGYQTFINWDDRGAVKCYGYDKTVKRTATATKQSWVLTATRDIRIGTNGALVQNMDPVVSIKERRSSERKTVTVVRCTGRVLQTQ
jgi:type II secretory pathway pseudopilin PulG